MDVRHLEIPLSFGGLSAPVGATTPNKDTAQTRVAAISF